MTVHLNDLISREEVIKAIGKIDNYGDGIAYEVLSHAMRDISLLPTVEAEPVRHGKWKQWDSYGFEETYECTACGESVVMMDGEHPLSNGFKYCPYCGAKMDGMIREGEKNE